MKGSAMQKFLALNRKVLRHLSLLGAAALICSSSSWLLGQSIHFKIPTPLTTPDPGGQLTTLSTTGSIDLSNSFFKSLGTNGRVCASCHIPSSAWTITPPEVQLRFLLSGGGDPIFRPVDGANCPSADVSTFRSRISAYSTVLTKGLIRISLPIPSGAEFEIIDIKDPYHCPETTTTQPAMYRRPLPSTNLKFLSTVMWDGRETVKGQAINLDLATQAVDATTGHAQASSAPTPQQVAEIVALETSLFTAQSRNNSAGDLTAQGALGGPAALSTQPFFIGINDPLGLNPTTAPFDSVAFTLYDKWTNLPGSSSFAAARRSVARGEMLFNTLPITITGVGGLNDLPGLSTVKGTCTTCHDAPNAGDHSVSQPLNIGVTDYPALPALDVAGLPVYTIQCDTTSPPTVVRTTDPGRAMVSGKCADIGKTKGPILRGLAARAPYFHNGSAATLGKAVDFYNQRFALGLTNQQKADLVAFLNTL
jgi:cytochrome c peroxidase